VPIDGIASRQRNLPDVAQCLLALPRRPGLAHVRAFCLRDRRPTTSRFRAPRPSFFYGPTNTGRDHDRTSPACRLYGFCRPRPPSRTRNGTGGTMPSGLMRGAVIVVMRVDPVSPGRPLQSFAGEHKRLAVSGGMRTGSSTPRDRTISGQQRVCSAGCPVIGEQVLFLSSQRPVLLNHSRLPSRSFGRFRNCTVYRVDPEAASCCSMMPKSLRIISRSPR